MLVIYRGYRRHRKRWVFGAALLGIVLVTAGLVAPSISDRPLVQLPAPAFLGHLGSSGNGALAEHPHAGCTDACCPTLAVTDSGATTLGIPAGGLLTILGSMFLIAGHSGNLLACRCFSPHRPDEGTPGCGCPA